MAWTSPPRPRPASPRGPPGWTTPSPPAPMSSGPGTHNTPRHVMPRQPCDSPIRQSIPAARPTGMSWRDGPLHQLATDTGNLLCRATPAPCHAAPAIRRSLNQYWPPAQQVCHGATGPSTDLPPTPAACCAARRNSRRAIFAAPSTKAARAPAT